MNTTKDAHEYIDMMMNEHIDMIERYVIERYVIDR